MEIDVIATVTATILSSIIAGFVSYLITKRTMRVSERRRLDDMLMQINMLSIQYPYVENERFIKDWISNRDSDNEKFLRYEAFCIIVFNYLERMSNFYKFKTDKIEEFVHIKEIVRMHRDWWQNPSNDYDNIEGYKPKFRDLINNYLV